MNTEKNPFAVSCQPNIWGDTVITATLGDFHSIAIVKAKPKPEEIEQKTFNAIRELLHLAIKELLSSRLNALRYTSGGDAKIKGIKSSHVFKNLAKYTRDVKVPVILAENISHLLLPLLQQAIPPSYSHYYPVYMHYIIHINKCRSYILSEMLKEKQPVIA